MTTKTRKKDDLRETDLSISITAALPGFSLITISRVYREKIRFLVSSSYLGKNAFLMPKVRSLEQKTEAVTKSGREKTGKHCVD